MNVVPCRWSNSGWKYIEIDAEEQKFFGNPNRRNSHGYNSPKAPMFGGKRVENIDTRVFYDHNWTTTNENTNIAFMNATM